MKRLIRPYVEENTLCEHNINSYQSNPGFLCRASVRMNCILSLNFVQLFVSVSFELGANVYIGFLSFSYDKHFQTTVEKHMSVEVCVVLPKFRLTLVRVELLPVTDHTPHTQQTAALKAGDTAVEEKFLDHWDLAYVLHTSGTTGLPKIVRVPHKCILPNILHLRSVITPVCLCSLLWSFILKSTEKKNSLFSDRCFRWVHMMWFSWPHL